MDNQTNKDDIKQLARKWMQGSLSPDEEAYFERWYRSFNDEEVVLDDSRYRNPLQLKKRIYKRLMTKIERVEPQEQLSSKKNTFARPVIRTAVIAASVLLPLLAGVYFFMVNKEQHHLIRAALKNDMAPGQNKAFLVLPNGQQVRLSSEHEGIVFGRSDFTYDDGTPVEGHGGAPVGGKPDEWVTVVTPYAGQYRVVLPDGSKVWLNSGSVLKYPNSFGRKRREVVLHGEAYFEVTKTAFPFEVQTAHQKVEVLGTSFNINAYENEPVTRTTLLTGAVRVVRTGPEKEPNGASLMLMPNQQAVLERDKLTVLDPVDVLDIIAWKDGMFSFKDMDLASIMRQVERWYDVQIDYASLPDIHFTGTIGKDVNLSEVLEMLELTSAIEFEISNQILRAKNNETRKK